MAAIGSGGACRLLRRVSMTARPANVSWWAPRRYSGYYAKPEAQHGWKPPRSRCPIRALAARSFELRGPRPASAVAMLVTSRGLIEGNRSDAGGIRTPAPSLLVGLLTAELDWNDPRRDVSRRRPQQEPCRSTL